MIIIKECSVCGRTDKYVRLYKDYNKVLCNKHRMQLISHGKILDFNSRSCYDLNEFIIHDDYSEICLYDKNSYIVNHAQIDSEDINKIKNYKWRISQKRNKLYVCTGQNKNGNKTIYLQNILMDYTPNGIEEVDHIDGNSLNNKKINLRLLSRIDNIHNTRVRKDNKSTGWRGISIDNRWNSYMVDFNFNKQRYNFKTFKHLEEALYLRYLCEIKFNTVRNSNRDSELFVLFSNLSELEKLNIKNYFEVIVNRVKII